MAIPCLIPDYRRILLVVRGKTYLEAYLKGKPISRIVVTHYHPDHTGLAGWLTGRYAAEFCLTALTYERTHYLLNPKSDEDKNNFAEFYGRHGVEDITSCVEFCLGASYQQTVSGLPPEKEIIIDGQRIEIGSHVWQEITWPVSTSGFQRGAGAFKLSGKQRAPEKISGWQSIFLCSKKTNDKWGRGQYQH